MTTTTGARANRRPAGAAAAGSPCAGAGEGGVAVRRVMDWDAMLSLVCLSAHQCNRDVTAGFLARESASDLAIIVMRLLVVFIMP